MAKKTRAELSTEAVTTNLPDNNQELITPATERAQLASERESTLNYKDDITGTAGQVLVVGQDGESIEFEDLGGGDVNVSGAPSADQIAIWTDATTIKGDPTLTIDTNGEIILVQDGQSGTPSRGMYNIGGGNMSVATGEENTGFGKQNLNVIEGGYHNTAVGAYSLFSLTGGVYNVAIGRNSLYSLIDQSSNTAVGNSSALNFIGSSGTFIGALSGGKRLSGSSNTAIGVNSLVGNSTVSLNTGNSNTAIGDASLNVVSSGSKNVALGKGSGSLITTGSSNVIIGSFTGTTGESPTPVYDIRTSSNNIVISDGDGNIRQTFDNSGAATFSNTVNAGTSAWPNGSINLFHNYGGVDAIGVSHANGAASGSTLAAFAYDGSVIGSITQSGTTGVSYNTSSDYRLKENITPITNALSRVSQLKPSRFNFISEADKTVDGFLAHEVQEIIPEAISGEKDALNEDGTPNYQGIDQSKIVPLLVAAIQEQQTIIEELKARIEKLEV
jgi:hypothetical protein